LVAIFIISGTGGEIMNKQDLVNEVAKVMSTKKEAQAAVDCIFFSITKALKKKDTVSLVGFGTFKVSKRKARKGRNPQSGEEIKIKAKNVPKFAPGKVLKDAVNRMAELSIAISPPSLKLRRALLAIHPRGKPRGILAKESK
jgi:DNA-binding protein HU-beta